MADTSIDILREEIKDFLKDADLSSASSKKVRAHLNKKFRCDFNSRKTEIDEVVIAVLTELENEDKKDSGEDDDDEPDDDSDDNYSEDEKPKKRKAPARKPTPRKKKAKASDSEKDSEEPSEEEDSEDDRKKKKKRASNGAKKKAAGGGAAKGGKGKTTGYLKRLKLSPELSEVMGEEFMARNEVVKKMYAVVKERDLFDPKNRQFAILDQQLQNVFGQKRVRMFGMLKLLGKHFSAVA